MLRAPLELTQFRQRRVSGSSCSVTQSCPTLTPWTAARQASLSFTIFRSLLRLVSIEPMRQSAGKSGPQRPSLGHPTESPEAFTVPPSTFLAHAAQFLKQPGLGALESVEEFPHLPMYLPNRQEHPFWCSSYPPAFYISIAGRFASNGPELEIRHALPARALPPGPPGKKKKTCFLVWQSLRAEWRSDLGSCRLLEFSARVRRLLSDINCREPRSIWRN